MFRSWEQQYSTVTRDLFQLIIDLQAAASTGTASQHRRWSDIVALGLFAQSSDKVNSNILYSLSKCSDECMIRNVCWVVITWNILIHRYGFRSRMQTCFISLKSRSIQWCNILQGIPGSWPSRWYHLTWTICEKLPHSPQTHHGATAHPHCMYSVGTDSSTETYMIWYMI